MEDIVLIGFGGHGKSVADCIERQGAYRIIGYTDCTPRNAVYAYLGADDALPGLFATGVGNAAVCIGYMGRGDLRERIYGDLKKIGFRLPAVIDPSAVVSSSARIEEGCFVGKGAVINAGAIVRKMAIINSMALVEHECEVGAFSHLAVGAVLCGQVRVGQGVFLGARSTVIQNLTVADNSFVAAGAVVTESIPEKGFAVGIPAKLI